MQQSLAMWERLVEEVRRVGPRKIVILALAAAAAVALAYGVNSTNNAANGSTLPHFNHAAVLSAGADGRR